MRSTPDTAPVPGVDPSSVTTGPDGGRRHHGPRSWTPWVVAAAWILTRALMLLVWAKEGTDVDWDVGYYANAMYRLAEVGPAATLREYPTPVLFLLRGVSALTFGDPDRFVPTFVLLMATLDGAFTAALARARREIGLAPAAYWIAFLALFGPVAFCRYDLVTVVAVAGAFLAVRHRPALAGVALAVGVALKLWPVILVPALWVALPTLRERVRVTWGVAAGLAVAIGASVAYAGVDRLLAPLTNQGARGLQIESVWAAPELTYGLATHTYDVDLRYGALEVVGPHVAALLQVATVATALALLSVPVLAWRADHGPQVPPGGRFADPWLRGLLVAATSIALFLVTNKALSAQYVVWIVAPLSLLLAGMGWREPGSEAVLARLAAAGPASRRTRLHLAWVGVAVAGLTHLLFPWNYTPLVLAYAVASPERIGASLTLLAVRNVLLIALTAWLVGLTWRTGRGRPRMRMRMRKRDQAAADGPPGD